MATAEKKVSAAASVAVLMMGVAWTWTTASAVIQPVPRNYRMPKPIKEAHPEWVDAKDPPSRPYYMPEPTDELQRLHKCWGYLARGKATGEVRQYFVNATNGHPYPSTNTCEGVNLLHLHCWPDMFRIFWQATDRLIVNLRFYCHQHAPRPPPDHFTAPFHANVLPSAAASAFSP